MLTYTLSKASKYPLYEQLYLCIRNDISSGKLLADTKLPSKRLFAEHLGVSKVTVEAAYSQLVSEGYIYSVEKKGYFVEKVTVVDKMPKKIVSELPQTEQYSADIKSNNVSLSAFPFSVWSKLMREVTLSYSREILLPVPFNGAPCLRRAICTYLAENRGMSVDPECIIVGSGTEYLYGLIIQLLGNNKKFALENPSYSKISKVYGANGAECTYVDMDSDGVNVKSLYEGGADVLHISPAHHFPSGTVTSQKRRYELLDWASKSNGRYIIEDEYDSEFRFIGKPIPPVQSIDANERVIYINTFSKTIAPSIRIAYMVLPPSLFLEFKQKLSFYSCTVPAFEQYTLAEFILRGYFERHISRMKRHYKTLRNDLISMIKKSSISGYVEILEPDSGLHFLMKLRTDKTDGYLTQKASDAGIRLAFLSEFYSSEPAPEHYVLVNYSGIDTEIFSKAINFLEDELCIEKLKDL